ncbi:MAG: hypothetical protein MSG64_06495 [Pyrinomonadaceae bacterium MAG19_C2-C3]|nr:hypothetical protein [Pyrinomonadaceae bacterium MAG19_C2-C3]
MSIEPTYKRNKPNYDIDDPNLESPEFYLIGDVIDQTKIDFGSDDFTHYAVCNGFKGIGIWILRGFDYHDEWKMEGYVDYESVASLTFSANDAMIFTPQNMSSNLQNAMLDLWEHQGNRFGDES